MKKPRVVLSAGNITHYHHAALALHRAGYLQRYFYSLGPTGDNAWWLRPLPGYWRRKVIGRRLPHLPPGMIETLPWIELLKRGLLAGRFLSPEHGDWLYSELTDRVTRARVPDCDIFHFVSTLGLETARKLKRNGVLLVCDVREAFPDTRRQAERRACAHLGLDFRPANGAYEQRRKAEFSLADYLIVPSKYVAQSFAAHGYEESKILVVPYGVDLASFAPMRDDLPGTDADEQVFRVLFVGRVAPGKGIHYLIEAFDKLNLPDSQLIIVGGLSKRMRPYLHSALRRNPRIWWANHVPHIDLARHYQAASVFVLPTVSEGSALVIYEAMAAELPVITTPNAGSIIRDGLDGALVPPHDVDALGDQLYELYRDPDRGRAMGQEAARRVGDFSWERYGDRLLAAYKAMTGGPEPAERS